MKAATDWSSTAPALRRRRAVACVRASRTYLGRTGFLLRLHGCVIAAALVAGIAVVPAQAQSPSADWYELDRSIGELFRAGAYAQGARIAQQALALARSSYGDQDPRTLVTLSNLAVLYRRLGRYDDAEPLLQEALAAQRAGLA